VARCRPRGLEGRKLVSTTSRLSTSWARHVVAADHIRGVREAPGCLSLADFSSNAAEFVAPDDHDVGAVGLWCAPPIHVDRSDRAAAGVGLKPLDLHVHEQPHALVLQRRAHTAQTAAGLAARARPPDVETAPTATALSGPRRPDHERGSAARPPRSKAQDRRRRSPTAARSRRNAGPRRSHVRAHGTRSPRRTSCCRRRNTAGVAYTGTRSCRTTARRRDSAPCGRPRGCPSSGAREKGRPTLEQQDPLARRRERVPTVPAPAPVPMMYRC
jgi:hypothetical protein